jgi:hypothetical protein
MITLSDIISRKVFNDFNLKDYYDINLSKESHECENVKEKLLHLEGILRVLVENEYNSGEYDNCKDLIYMLNSYDCGFILDCGYDENDNIKPGTLRIELKSTNPYITYDTAIRIIVDNSYSIINMNILNGIHTSKYILFTLNEVDKKRILSVPYIEDFISGRYFSSSSYRNKIGGLLHVDNILEFVYEFCEYNEDRDILKRSDLSKLELLDMARTLLMREIKKRHENGVTDKILVALEYKFQLGYRLINVLVEDELLHKDPKYPIDLNDKARLEMNIDYLDSLYARYNLPDEYKFRHLYESDKIKRKECMNDLQYLFKENNRLITNYLRKSYLK